ncbi:MAG: hypothetical protein K0S55_1844, partial [Clostridia bacterium]|nr:hypothetical protein [Clostridia bacterium]
MRYYVKAVIFDLFETLVTEWGHEKYTKRKMAIDLGVDVKIFNDEWEHLHHDMYMGKYKDFTSALSFILNKMNLKIDPELIKTVAKKRISTKAKCFDPIAININIIAMLNDIKHAGYKLGLISNCDFSEITAFRSFELYSLFDTVLLSCDEKLIKPDNAIYDLCAKKLNVIPSDCLFFGDGGCNELDGALNAGMKAAQAVWFIKV